MRKFAIFRAIRYNNCVIFGNVPCYEANYLHNAISYRKCVIQRKFLLFAKVTFFANIRFLRNFKVITEKFHNYYASFYVISRKIRATLSKFHVVLPIAMGYYFISDPFHDKKIELVTLIQKA